MTDAKRSLLRRGRGGADRRWQLQTEDEPSSRGRAALVDQGAQRRRQLIALSVDYGRVVANLEGALDAASVGTALLAVLAKHYAQRHGRNGLVEFRQAGATYLFDFASSADAPQEDRTVAAWTVTPAVVGSRDVSYQRGYPMSPGAAGAAVDRGHLIPHLSGGQFGPNIFRQDRALNRGWSDQGRRYRALEREAAAALGCLFFAHLIYTDETAEPSEIEIGVLRGASLHVERFDNRPADR